MGFPEDRNAVSRTRRAFGVPELNPESRGLPEDVRARLKEAVRAGGGNQAVAERAGVPLSTLNGALSGKNNPRATAIAAITRATGRSLDWLFFNEAQAAPVAPEGAESADEPLPKVHEDLLRKAICLVDEWLDANQRIMDPEKKAHVVTMIYQFAIEDEQSGEPSIDTRRVGQFLRLVR